MSIYIGKCSELCTVKHGMQSMDDLNTIHTQNNKMKNIYVILLYHRYKFIYYSVDNLRLHKALTHLIDKKCGRTLN